MDKMKFVCDKGTKIRGYELFFIYNVSSQLKSVKLSPQYSE